MNLYNPEVREALADVVRFWMNLGVHGFRLDTANYYAHDRQLRDYPKLPMPIEDGQEANRLSGYITKYSKDCPKNLEFIHFLRNIFNEKANMTAIAEIGISSGLDTTLKLGTYYVKYGYGLHTAYTFAMLSKEMNVEYFDHVVRFSEEMFEDGWPCWSLSNHDCTRMITRYNCFAEREVFQ